MEYHVYVKVKDGHITAVDSSAFLADTAGWVEIDAGSGDRFHHAQGNYFPESLVTDSGAYRYKLTDGEAVPCTPEELEAQEAANTPAPVPDKESVWDELDAAYQSGYQDGYAEGVNSIYDQ